MTVPVFVVVEDLSHLDHLTVGNLTMTLSSGSMGMPQCLTLVHNDAGEQIVYGDSKGAAIMLLCGSREWPARDMISGAEHQDYIMVHQVRE